MYLTHYIKLVNACNYSTSSSLLQQITYITHYIYMYIVITCNNYSTCSSHTQQTKSYIHTHKIQCGCLNLVDLSVHLKYFK